MIRWATVLFYFPIKKTPWYGKNPDKGVQKPGRSGFFFIRRTSFLKPLLHPLMRKIKMFFRLWLENTHRSYSPASGKSINGISAKSAGAFTAPVRLRQTPPPPYVIGQPSLTLYIAHFPDISHLCPPVTHISLRAVSHSANWFGIPFLKKLLNSAKMRPHKRKFSIKIS